MIRRYLLRATRMQFRLAGRPVGNPLEMWIGIEIDSVEPLDIERIERETKRHLIPCDGMTSEEIRSCGVTKFDRIAFE